jgi:hypothetical protein
MLTGRVFLFRHVVVLLNESVSARSKMPVVNPLRPT